MTGTFKLSLHRYSIHRFTKKLLVRESVIEHNHRIGPDVSAYYLSNRKLTKEKNAAINEVLSLQPKTKYVKEMIKITFRKYVTLKDVHNLKKEQITWMNSYY